MIRGGTKSKGGGESEERGGHKRREGVGTGGGVVHQTGKVTVST